MKVSKLDRQIARAIVMAQLASDAGTYTYWVLDRTPVSYYGAVRLRYNLKLPEILRALRMIDSARKSVWRYYVELTFDQNGYESYLVYFEMKDESGERIQISFHNPAWKSRELARWEGKGRKTRWNHRLGGSRDDARRLVEIFDL